MVEAVLFDKHQIVPACVLLDGEYGINNLCVGVPAKLGASGIEEVIDIKLTSEEQKALKQSSEAVEELLEVMNNRNS